MSNVIERLNIVASYAVVNLYDTLVAICSWATLFDEKKEGISKATVFFASECLDKIMEALIGNPLIWESKLEIQTALESLFVHLILEKTVLQKVIDSVVYLLRLLLQRNSNVSSLAEIQQVKIAKQFAEAVRIILHDFVENSPQPELQDQLKTLQNEILALKNQSDPKAMFQLRELYLDLTHLSSIVSLLHLYFYSILCVLNVKHILCILASSKVHQH